MVLKYLNESVTDVLDVPTDLVRMKIGGEAIAPLPSLGYPNDRYLLYFLFASCFRDLNPLLSLLFSLGSIRRQRVQRSNTRLLDSKERVTGSPP